MNFSQSHAVATEDLALMSLMYKFRSNLADIIAGQAQISPEISAGLQKQISTTKSMCESIDAGERPNTSFPDMFSLLISVENPSDWDNFRQILDNRLRQIENLDSDPQIAADLTQWANKVLEVLQQRGLASGHGVRQGWSL